MPRRIMLLLSFIILQNVDITHSSSYKNQVNYCSYNDKFVSNIIKDVTNGTLECKRDYTFIPLKQNIEIQYIWILTDENILTNLENSDDIYISTAKSDWIDFKTVYEKDHKRVSCAISLIRTDKNTGEVIEKCNGTFPTSYSVTKLKVSDFFGRKSFGVYLLFAVGVCVIITLYVGSVGAFVYYENRKKRKGRMKINLERNEKRIESLTANLISDDEQNESII